MCVLKKSVRFEQLAYWYLRMNGFLCLSNFVVHPDTGSNQKTDIDVVGVRFMHRRENFTIPMPDDPDVCEKSCFAQIIFAEVKIGFCSINKSWNKENIKLMLNAVGCVPENSISNAADGLWEVGVYTSGTEYQCQLLAFGEENSQMLKRHVKQITWKKVIAFMFKRFKDYESQKANVNQWPEDGKLLQNLAKASNTIEEFERKISEEFICG